MPPGEGDSWSKYVSALELLRTAIHKSSAVNVNASGLREGGKRVVQTYFRSARPELRALGFLDHQLAGLDGTMHALLRLTQGRNARRTYESTLKTATELTRTMEGERELKLGEAQAAGSAGAVTTEVEARILEVMEDLAPTAAIAYSQAVSDLSDETRQSFKGPANELREALREVLDRLAPDSAVSKADWYKPEKGQTHPTQKQKMRFILSNRGLSRSARKMPEDTVQLVDELTASVARGSYQRSSVAAHVAATRAEVLQLKMYVDTVLAEILEIHNVRVRPA